MNKQVFERFWSKVRIADDANGCWEWLAGRSSEGRYGTFCLDGKMDQAHRSSWTINRGPIPDGQCVLHSCDNTICVRPSHLFLGTQADNVEDMMCKGRHGIPATPCGSKHPESKLDEKKVAEIRVIYGAGNISQKALAAQYGVTAMVVNKIVRRKSWKHLP